MRQQKPEKRRKVEFRWTSKAQARLELFRWMSYYNRRRRHSALGYLTPVEFEQRLIASHALSLAA